ncbi:Protein like [Actinidia chinensis var. chinensis]|uniref:Protein like n=1 Tax=Actinidia chinensis var. chinensis TaxID=1590841 RepID=A0A2R6RK63_ACTCC|nr:Protein like [Actinidia chinensis var. chinensis]
MKVGETALGTSPSAGYANSNRLNNSPAEYSSSDTAYPAWSELDRTSSLDPFPQAHRSTDQWMKVGETALGTSPSAGYANSNRLNNSPAEYSSSDTAYPAWSELDRTSSLDPFPQAHRSTDQWMKVGETARGTSPSAGYANSNRLNNSPAEYSSSATSSQAWFALDGGEITNRTVCVDMVHGDGTATMDPLSQARRKTDQWMKVGETVLGTSASAGYANSNRLNKSPAEYSSSATSSQAWFALDGGAIKNRTVCVDMVHGDGTATMNPLSQERRTTDQWMKVGETVLGTSASVGYASSSSQAKFPFVGNASVCINVGSNLNDIHGDGTATMDPILQERLSTDQWVKLTEIVLAISATVVYSSSTHFPKAANAVGFIASLTAISLRSKWQTATRVLAKFGAIACAAGTLAAIGNDLPEEYKWIGTVAFHIPSVAVLFA